MPRRKPCRHAALPRQSRWRKRGGALFTASLHAVLTGWGVTGGRERSAAERTPPSSTSMDPRSLAGQPSSGLALTRHRPKRSAPHSPRSGSPGAIAAIMDAMEIILIGALLLVVFLVLSVAVVGLALKLLWWLVIGLAVGALARLVLPGQQPIGLLRTALFGAAGALIGGVLAHVFGWGAILTLLLAVAIAALLVAVLAGTDQRRVA